MSKEEQKPSVTNEMMHKMESDTDLSLMRVKHLANPGDVISTLAGMRSIYLGTKRKIIYQQCVDTPAQYYPGAIHPTVDEKGVPVTMNQKMFDMMKPLVESQEYIHEFVKFEGQEVHINLDVIRGQTDVNMPHGMLAAWPMYAFPDLAYDLSEPWIFLPDKKHPIQKQTKGKIIINFTDRYRNPTLDYYFLKPYVPDLIFAGTEGEYFRFCNKWGLNIPKLETNDFLETAYAIKAARFILANQSMLWNLCEAMRTPRLLEVCKWADNCQPFIGKNSFGYFYQIAAEYYFRRMYNTLK